MLKFHLSSALGTQLLCESRENRYFIRFRSLNTYVDLVHAWLIVHEIELNFNWARIWVLSAELNNFVSPSDILPSASRLEENVKEREMHIWKIFYICVHAHVCALSPSTVICLLQIKKFRVINTWTNISTM